MKTVVSVQLDQQLINQEYTVDFDTTAKSVIEDLYMARILPTDDYDLYETRQHEKKKFVRKCIPSESLLVLIFNWSLSSHMYSFVIKRAQPSIYLGLRKELCRSLPKEALLQRQTVIANAEGDALQSVSKRVEYQKKLIDKRLKS